MAKLLSFVIRITFALLLVQGQNYAQGGHGGAHLRAPIGAASFSMGGATSAKPEYLCSWKNPAALASLRENHIFLGTGLRSLHRTSIITGLEFPLKPRGAFGLSLFYNGDTDIDNIHNDQEWLINQDGHYVSISGKIGVAYRISKKFFAGINFNILYQNISSYINDNATLSSSKVTSFGGMDIGVQYLLSKRQSFGLTVQYLLASYNWSFDYGSSGGLSAANTDTLLAPVTIAQQRIFTLLGRPFIWSTDLKIYAFNSKFKNIRENQLLVNNGFEWQKWDTFFIRFGIRDLRFNSNIYKDSDRYLQQFSLAVSGGFMLDLTKALKGRNVVLNYGIANDKAVAGIDQQLDFIFSF